MCYLSMFIGRNEGSFNDNSCVYCHHLCLRGSHWALSQSRVSHTVFQSSHTQLLLPSLTRTSPESFMQLASISQRTNKSKSLYFSVEKCILYQLTFSVLSVLLSSLSN